MKKKPYLNADIGISSLIWNASDLKLALEILKSYNIRSIDLTPWEYLEPGWQFDDAVNLSALVKHYDINIVGMQGLYYGISDANIFDVKSGRAEFVRRSIECIRLAGILGARYLIAGAPGTRQLRNSISKETAKFVYAEILGALVPLLERENLIYCIEPVSVSYGEELVTSSKIAFEICSLVRSPFVRVNFDAGFSIDENYKDLIVGKNIIAHGHVAKFDHSMVDKDVFYQFDLDKIARVWSVEVAKTGSLGDLINLCELVKMFKDENRIFANCCSTY